MSKEWKGNSNSARAAIAAKKPKSKTKREEDDFYATDPYAVRRLVEGASGWLRGIFRSCKTSIPDFEKPEYELYYNGKSHTHKCYSEYDNDKQYYDRYINIHPIIWECAVGSCNLFDELYDLGYDVIGSDIKDRCGREPKELLNSDFLKADISFTMQHRIGVILTNPPYSLATEFILHALEVLPENGVYCAFMNISYLAGQKRFVDVYMSGTLREVYIFSKRVECWRNNIPSGHSSIANYAWYVFQKGYFGQPVIYWL